MLTLGDVRIVWLRGGRFRLDGGAMFGPVPKPLWSKRYPHEEDNSIPMQAYPLLVLTPTHRILVDTGLGDKLNAKQRRNFHVHEEWALDESLAALGLTADDVDLVILTHMDWDHAGGATRRAPGGEGEGNGGSSPAGAEERIVPSFRRARYIVQEAEWEAALHPDSRTRAGYWPENWRPLLKAGLVETVDGDAEVAPGVYVHKTGGHTHGHQIVRIEAGGETVLHMGDLLPTHAHSNPLWIMSYDNFPLTSVAQKERWLGEAKRKGWWLTFYHDPFLLAGTLDEEGRWVRTVPGALGWPAQPIDR